MVCVPTPPLTRGSKVVRRGFLGGLESSRPGRELLQEMGARHPGAETFSIIAGSPAGRFERMTMNTTTITDVRLLQFPDAAKTFDVTFSGDALSAVEPASTATAEGEVVEGRGRTLLPGLIDTHVHLLNRSEMEAATRAGVTTVVDLGTHPDQLVDELRAQEDVCDLLSAGSAASAPGSTQISYMGFPSESGVSGPDDAERYLAWRVAAGSDLIKIIVEDPDSTDVPALSPETLAALVAAAHERDLLTVAHVVTAGAFDRGLDAGVDVLTHAPVDRPLPEQTVGRMVDARTVASPTLVMMRGVTRARFGEHAEEAFAASVESVRRMHAAGVPIVAGTDANASPGSPSPVPHGSSLHDELQLLCEAGLSATEALISATSGAAAALRLDDRGTIAAGQRADLILTDGDATDLLSAARTPGAVWVAGQKLV